MPTIMSFFAKSLAGLLVLASLAACATLDTRSVNLAPQPSGSGNLLNAKPYFLKPAGDWQGLMSWLSLTVLKGSIDTALLTKLDYESWRHTRMSGASDVQAIAIRFETEILPGQPDHQSGMLFLPAARTDKTIELTWLVWCKGTELLRDAVPSHNAGAETAFAAAFASLGYAVWMPDYGGMGDSPGYQPYCVPQSLGLSAMDGLVAARQYLAENADYYRENGNLYVLGYSEGGLAAMASLREIVRHPAKISGLRLRTVFSMAAPLNLMIGVDDQPLDNVVLNRPEYSLYLVIGWARAYPEQIKLAEILRPDINARIVPLYDGQRDNEALHRAIAGLRGKPADRINYGDLFRPEYLARFRTDRENLPYYQLQVAERLDRPEVPEGTHLVLAASPSDQVVNPENSHSAYAWLQANHPESAVELVHLGSRSHSSAGAEALLYAIQQIDQSVHGPGAN